LFSSEAVQSYRLQVKNRVTAIAIDQSNRYIAIGTTNGRETSE